eukprot:scaffold3676_cov103-Skeletonema_dohrnii-CCMP3373.AAC.6
MIRLHVHLRARSLSILGCVLRTCEKWKRSHASRMSDRTQRATGTTTERKERDDPIKIIGKGGC